MLTRRHFIGSTAALFSAPIASTVSAAPTSDRSRWAAWDAQVTPVNYDPATSNPWGFHRRFLPQRVEANAGLTPGDIHVDAVRRRNCARKPVRARNLHNQAEGKVAYLDTNCGHDQKRPRSI